MRLARLPLRVVALAGVAAFAPAASADRAGIPPIARATVAHATVISGRSVGPKSLALPLRLTFYYPWFPETWPRPDRRPGLFSRFQPSLGAYNSGDASIIRRHLAAMRYAHIQGLIASWWGRRSKTDQRITALLTEAVRTPVRLALYYEPEGTSDPTPAQIMADLSYIRHKYSRHKGYLRIGGKFVVFVYADSNDGCEMAKRWRAGWVAGAYVVLKVFSGYRSCAAQPNGWHQYSPAVAESRHGSFSYSISPGFFKADEPSPRLARDLRRFRGTALRMERSGARFQLVTTFNEWGEGTAVESARQWRSPSGYGRYLDVLHAIPHLRRAPGPTKMSDSAPPRAPPASGRSTAVGDIP